jgi:hypothetical protein
MLFVLNSQEMHTEARLIHYLSPYISHDIYLSKYTVLLPEEAPPLNS